MEQHNDMTEFCIVIEKLLDPTDNEHKIQNTME